MMVVSILYISLVTSLCLAQSTSQFQFEPQSVVQAEGLDSIFECLRPGARSHLWGINGWFPADNEFPSELTREPPSGDRPARLIIPAIPKYNNTVVQCEAWVRTGALEYSENASLIVSAMTAEVMNRPNLIEISWSNEITTSITYCVDIKQTIQEGNETHEVISECGLTETQYHFSYFSHSVCDRFSISVTPTEGEMKGTPSEPVTGYFTQARGALERIFVRQGDQMSKKLITFILLVPECTRYTSYQVGSDEPRELQSGSQSNGSVSITSSLTADMMTNFSLTLSNSNEIDIVFDISLSTYDVQGVHSVMECSQGGSVCGVIDFIPDTRSPGALLCMIPIASDTLDYSDTTIATVPKENSNFSVSVPAGRYQLLAFDIEINGVLRFPLSTAAYSTTVMVSNPIEDNTEPSPVPQKGTDLSDGGSSVSCSEDMICLMMIHSLDNPEQLNVQLIDTPATISFDTNGTDFMVVYSWTSNASIFNGHISFMARMDLQSMSVSTPGSPTDTTTNNYSPDGGLQVPLPSGALAGIVIVVPAVIVLSMIIVTLVILITMRRLKSRGKVLTSNHYHATSGSASNGFSNKACPDVNGEIGIYDVACEGNMCTPSGDDVALSNGYDIIRAENIQSPEYDAVPSNKIIEYEAIPFDGEVKRSVPSHPEPPLSVYESIPTPETTIYESIDVTRPRTSTQTFAPKPPPLPPRQDNEPPALPPPYNPEVDLVPEEDLVASKLIAGEAEAEQEAGVTSEAEQDDCSSVGSMSRTDIEHSQVETEQTSSHNEDNCLNLTNHVYAQVNKKKRLTSSAESASHRANLSVRSKQDTTTAVYAQVNKKRKEPSTSRASGIGSPHPTFSFESVLGEIVELSGRWEDLAKALQVDEDKIEDIFSSNENDKLRLHELLEYYFEAENYSHTWDEIVEVLEKMEEHALVDDIRQGKLQIEGSSHLPQHASILIV